MQFDKLSRDIMDGKNADALRSAAESPAGKRLAGMFDPGEVERLAKSGDRKSLEQLMKKILSTAEGRELAQQVQKAVGKNGR